MISRAVAVQGQKQTTEMMCSGSAVATPHKNWGEQHVDGAGVNTCDCAVSSVACR
jgi:hypothetical protein